MYDEPSDVVAEDSTAWCSFASLGHESRLERYLRLGSVRQRTKGLTGVLSHYAHCRESSLLGEASQNFWAFLVAPLVWTTRIVWLRA